MAWMQLSRHWLEIHAVMLLVSNLTFLFSSKLSNVSVQFLCE